MLTVLILLGEVAAGVILAVGWLHWRGVARFGRRGTGWGLGTLLIGLVQAVVWSVLPGDPAVWWRLLVLAVGVLLIVLAVGWRRGTIVQG